MANKLRPSISNLSLTAIRSAIDGDKQFATLPDLDALVKWVHFARSNTLRFRDDPDPDTPLQWIALLSQVDREKAIVRHCLGEVMSRVSVKYRERLQALGRAILDDPESVQTKSIFRRFYSPENVPRTGGARRNALATWNGIVVREIAERVPVGIPNRWSCISRLAALADVRVTNQYVRSLLTRYGT